MFFKGVIFKALNLTSLLLVFFAAALRGESQPTPCDQPGQPCSVVAGYDGNSISIDALGATIGGGGQTGFPNQVTGSFGTVSGGRGNQAGEQAVVAGGTNNVAGYFRSVVVGGAFNTADSAYGTISGGINNLVDAYFATVGGGSNNQALDVDATVSGGSGNIASFRRATVGGGSYNVASSLESTVSGGSLNLSSGPYSFIGGGFHNTASGFAVTISGGNGSLATGENSAVGGGLSNQAQGGYSTIGGGRRNQTGGLYSIIPGGLDNLAGGDYSLAAGSRARIDPAHPGTFLFSDSNLYNFLSQAANEFAVRATGGVRFVTGLDESGQPLTGVRLSPGGGSWESLSDREAKTAVLPVDGKRVLERLISLPVSTWRYRVEPEAAQHMGPMAQDFHAAFGLGEDERYIGGLDANGVALAAIQGLYQVVQEKDTRIAALQAQVDRQEARLKALEGVAAGGAGGIRVELGWPVFGGLALLALAVWWRGRDKQGIAIKKGAQKP
jgi:hypothetical protein